MILSLIFTYAGSLVIWFFKGMRGAFEDEQSARLDHDFKYYRNFFTGLAFISLTVLIIFKLIS